MQHFPIFLAVAGRRITVSGGGEAAVAKLRLLLKTEAHINVFAPDPLPQIEAWAAEGKLTLHRRAQGPGDALCAVSAYGANEDDAEDARVADLARADGALVNIVDNLEESAFITPAIVDRDPVTVAIGTEGAAPVLARAIKADLEAALPQKLGLLARVGKAFRAHSMRLAPGRARRDFWRDYYFGTGARAETEAAAQDALTETLDRHLAATAREAHVFFVGAGPGDPDLLTLKARKILDEADVVIHDRLVPAPILELARREATVIEAGKTGFGPAMAQDDINDLILAHAKDGAQVVRLKSGDATVFGRLDEEITAILPTGLAYTVVPGITAASAAAADMGVSLTRRGRNSDLRMITGHDTKGFTEQDWRALARPEAVAAIYMGKRAARFLQGRLLMHGAAPDTPVTVVENAGRAEVRQITTTLGQLEPTVTEAGLLGPAVLMLGLAPHKAAQAAAALTHSPADLSEAL